MIIIDKKYIYLDWNIFKYMKDPRKDKGKLDKQFKELVFKLKNKYKFPFSYAHIRDRLNHYSEEYYEKVKQDFEFVESISDSICVGIKDYEPVLCKKSTYDLFDNCLREKKLNISESFKFSYKVDIEKLDENHPMYDFLIENNGKVDEKWLKDVFQKIYQDIDLYKKIRNYSNKIDLNNYFDRSDSYNKQLYKLLYHLYPFINSFWYDEENLKKNWDQIAKRYFSLNSNSELKKEQLLIQGYILLDMHPLFQEKLKKGKNTLDNILRDGNHCFYASKSQYFVSEDECTRKKISFLYDVYNIKTKVVCENEFVKCFEVI